MHKHRLPNHKQERYNQNAANVVTKIVLERTYHFNNICYGTSLES